MNIKLLFSLLFFLLHFQASCQQDKDFQLQNILTEYENAVNYEAQDSIWNRFLVGFEQSLKIDTKPNFSELQKQLENQMGLRLRQSHSEDGRFIAYSISRNFQNWNFVVLTENNGNPKIILKNPDAFAYYKEIHNLTTKNEFLLITQFNEMSYSCDVAYVMQLNSAGNFIPKPAFTNNKEALEVCSWTRLDNSYPVKDTVTGEMLIKGGLETYQPAVIGFDYKKRTIFFSKNGKKFREAKYRKRRFAIIGYDERADLE